MPSLRVMLPSHGAKMSSLHPLHLMTVLHPVTSHLEPKSKHWICTSAAGHSPQIAQVPPSTAIKKVISILAALPITQLRLPFASSLSRASCHRSPTHRHHSLLPLFHAHRPFAQWHPRWQTSWPSFASRITYRYVNSRKNIKLVIKYLWIINFIMARL
jgi:hypothetical protein